MVKIRKSETGNGAEGSGSTVAAVRSGATSISTSSPSLTSHRPVCPLVSSPASNMVIHSPPLVFPSISDQIGEWFRGIIDRRKVIASAVSAGCSVVLFFLLTALLQASPWSPFASVYGALSLVVSLSVWTAAIVVWIASFFALTLINITLAKPDTTRRLCMLRKDAWGTAAIFFLSQMVLLGATHAMAEAPMDSARWLFSLTAVAAAAIHVVFRIDYRLVFGTFGSKLSLALWECVSVEGESPLGVAVKEAALLYRVIMAVSFVIGSLLLGFYPTLSSLLSPSLHISLILSTITALFVGRAHVRITREIVMKPIHFPLPPPHAVRTPTPAQTRTMLNVLEASDATLKIFALTDLARLSRVVGDRRLEIFSLSQPVYSTAIRSRHARTLRATAAIQPRAPPRPTTVKRIKRFLDVPVGVVSRYDATLVQLAAESIHLLIVASFDEDRYGVVQRDLAEVLRAILKTANAIREHFRAARAHTKEQEELAAKREEAQTRIANLLEADLENEMKKGLLLGDKVHGGSPFDYLMFTMIYPTATCMADDDQVPGSCEIPSGTSQWTIHGLWPNFADGSYPQFCDHQKYDRKQVEQLHEQMRTKWPNLFPKTPEDQLWSHEWEKHGTCSKTDPLLDSQFKYFNMTLFLLDHVDIRTRMEQKGISPRSAPYERDTLQKSLDDLMGHHVQMYCLQDKKTHESLLADIRVCMDADLKPVDCPKADIHPYVRAGTVTPNDRQPLPVPRKCSESVYYVAEGTDISKSIDVLPPGKDSDETGKKLATDEEKDDYYDDEDVEEVIKNRNKNLRHHSSAHQGDLSLSKDDIASARNYARVTEMARQFQESRARGSLPGSLSSSIDSYQPLLTPLRIYVSIGCLLIYLVIITAFFCSRRDRTQHYGRLQHA